MKRITTRLVTRSALRVFNPPYSCTLTNSFPQRTKDSKQVPVTTFTGTNTQDAQRSVLEVQATEALSKPLPTEDVINRRATAFDKSVIQNLTPTMKNFTLQSKVAVVTGGARGLGWNMSQALAEAGVQAVALLDVKHELGNGAAAELHQTTGIPVQFYKVDVRDANAIAEVITKVKADLGSVDIVINAAGIVESNIKAEEYDATNFRNIFDINLTGSFLVSQACARHMIQDKIRGSIMFLSSIAGTRVLHPQQQCAYNSSKAAVAQLARSLAAEWAQYGIRVNTIAPGYMDTKLNREALPEWQRRHCGEVTPMGRMGTPDELNGVAVWLASDASGFVTGSEILVDGGYAVY